MCSYRPLSHHTLPPSLAHVADGRVRLARDVGRLHDAQRVGFHDPGSGRRGDRGRDRQGGQSERGGAHGEGAGVSRLGEG